MSQHRVDWSTLTVLRFKNTGPHCALPHLVHVRILPALSCIIISFTLSPEPYYVVEGFLHSSVASFGYSFLYRDRSCLRWQRGGRCKSQQAAGAIAKSEWMDEPTRDFEGIVDEFWSWCDRSIFMVRTQRLRAAVPTKTEMMNMISRLATHEHQDARPQVAGCRSEGRTPANFARGGVTRVFSTAYRRNCLLLRRACARSSMRDTWRRMYDAVVAGTA